MLGSTLSLSVGKRVSLPTGLDIPTLSLAETGDDEISYTIGEVSGANQYRVEKSTDGVTYTLLANQSTHGTYTDSGLTEGQIYYYRVRAEDTLTSEVSDYSVASLTLLAEFLTTSLTDSTNLENNSNIFTLTVQPDTALSAGSSITLSGLTGSATADGSLTISGAGASIFGSVGSWTQSTGTLVLTVDTAQTLPTGSDTVVTFTLTNSASSSGVTSVDLSSSGFTTASISGLFLEAVANLFSVALSDIESNIRASTTSVIGDTAYGTNTQDFYVFDGTNWQIYNNL